MDINIDFATIKSAVRQQLSVIGKHHASQQGGSLFSTTTLTDIETNVMPTFIVASAQLIISELSPMVYTYNIDEDCISFDVSPSRWGDVLPSAFYDGVQSFIIADVMQSVLNMIAPDLAPKYATDAKNQLAALSSMAFTKQPPAPSSVDYTSVAGTMYNDNGTEFTKPIVV